ncbi:hypothetical protein [Chitinophaga vietnamensis]|uniref:hypothetical protein n=1 Tax=Chitinophaga vietnamensis TaxID=2593957 RepID=UPI001177471F|nr:hypothetical protein [Chitinophaga vietnamensis]
MRKQLAETQEIDRYLLQQLAGPDRLVFQARSILSPALQEKTFFQEKVHRLIRWFSRNEKRKELESLHQQLMQDETFRQSINSIFQ